MKYPTRHFGDIRGVPGGTHQEMSYYRAWLDRYAGLKRHIDELDPKDLCGYDQEILNRHDEIKALVDADRAAEIIELTIYSKWMKPSTMIAARLKMGHPDVAKLFSALKNLAHENPQHRWGLYGEAVDAFCKTTLCHFGTDAPIDINSYHELEDAFENFGAAVGKSHAPEAFEVLSTKYAIFIEDVATAEADGADLFYEDCDHEEKEDLEEIIGNVECSNKDLEDLDEALRGYTDGYDVLLDWKSNGRDFYDRIDPDGVAMSYTLMGLQWYHMWARNVGPCLLTDLLGRNKMWFEGFINRLEQLFPNAKPLCFKANKAIDLYTNFVHDAAQFKLDRTATELKRQAKLESVFEALRNVAYAIKEQEESYMKTFIVTNPNGGAGNRGGDIIDSDVGVYHDLMSEDEYQEAIQEAAREQTRVDEKAEARHKELMAQQLANNEILKEIRDNTRKHETEREDVIALIREVHNAKINGVTSYLKAANYIRCLITEADAKFYRRAMWARSFVKEHCKSQAHGEDAYWSSLAQDSKPSAARQRNKRKDGLSGPVETLFC